MDDGDGGGAAQTGPASCDSAGRLVTLLGLGHYWKCIPLTFSDCKTDEWYRACLQFYNLLPLAAIGSCAKFCRDVWGECLGRKMHPFYNEKSELFKKEGRLQIVRWRMGSQQIVLDLQRVVGAKRDNRYEIPQLPHFAEAGYSRGEKCRLCRLGRPG